MGYQHTSVADIPGYPTRKLLFGFPDTLTLADAICSQILSPHWALQPSLAASPAGVTRLWKGAWYELPPMQTRPLGVF
jgi:hypothetical protein